MKQILVSIVTPVYNAESFIDETIKTVKMQTYQNWELLLIDDCSTDDSISIIKESQKHDSRIKLLKQKTNAGAAKARNAGTAASKGRFVAFLDADDLWEKNKLEMQVNAALQPSSSGFIFSSYRFADENGVAVADAVNVPKSIDYYHSLKNHIIWTSTVLIDVEKIPKELCYMPDVRRGQDAATWWQILRTTGIKAEGIQETLALYRRTNSSLSANKIKAVKRTWFLYRSVEKLNIFQSSYNFCFYAFNAVRKRV